jgi:hypothetical protein
VSGNRRLRDPCPWCGRNTLAITREEGDFAIACNDCDFELELDPQALIDAWKQQNEGRIANLESSDTSE